MTHSRHKRMGASCLKERATGRGVGRVGQRTGLSPKIVKAARERSHNTHRASEGRPKKRTLETSTLPIQSSIVRFVSIAGVCGHSHITHRPSSSVARCHPFALMYLIPSTNRPS